MVNNPYQKGSDDVFENAGGVAPTSAAASQGSSSRRPSLKARAIGYLSRREHSRQELARKLAPHANPDNPNELEELLNELEKGNWLSNERFAQSLVNRRAPGKGTAAVMHELRQHGLNPGQLASIQQELANTELERAKAVWEKKFGVPPASAKDKAKQIRFMASRGFSASVLGKILGDLNDF
ncbi:MAG: recombination regulator RecX [Pusillimonas sp.]|jgi:regulatory protein|nr:recombination regulator RecX [Pusillimonas sp.]